MKKASNNKTVMIIKTAFMGGFLSLLFLFLGQQIIHSTKSSFTNHSKLIEQAYAETQAETQLETGVAIPEHGNKFDDFQAYIKAVFDFSLKLGVALTALMLIYAGYKYMTSQGNPTALNEAKDIMVGSLSGFIMLLLVYLILNVFNL